ncbi:MAG: EpsG family protein [Clostridia bacterium]|nr:EpsG family protein [Clostridia bacterium]
MYLICLLVIVVFATIFLSKQLNSKKAFLVVAAIVLILYAGLRTPSYSGDVESYVNKFNTYKLFSFNEIINLYSANTKNPSFHFLGWLFSRVFDSAQLWLAFIGAVYVICTIHVIFKESESPLLSVIVLLALGYFAFTLSGLRQSMAMSFTMLAYFPAKNRKIFKFVLLVLIASLFHLSALIFLLVYPFANKKLGWSHFIVGCVAFVAFFFFQGQIRRIIANLLEDSYLGGYADRYVTITMSGLIIQVAIFIFNLFYYKKVINKNGKAKILYNLAFFGIIFQLFASMIAEMFRISMYFSVFNILLIPLSLSVENNKKIKNVLSILIYATLFVYMFRDGIPDYTFFWQ